MKIEKIKRYLSDTISVDALAYYKMAFISGPRQCGKSTLGRSLLQTPENEFTWDQTRFRTAWAKDPETALQNRGPGPVLLDELHKDRKWKQRLKGLYDLHAEDIPIVVTGSARLDYFQKSGDSLLGRYIPYRLHPFSVGETATPPSPENWLQFEPQTSFTMKDILHLTGFPEPLLRGSDSHAKRWSRLRVERLLNEDIRDFRNVSDLHAMGTLVALLPDRVGSRLSVNSLREDVGVAYATVRDWILVLQSLYVCFTIRPYTGNLKRSLKAEPKLYLFDHTPISNIGARLENICANHLLKACQFWTDTAMDDFSLHYFSTKDGVEIDFAITKNKKLWMLVECKTGNTQVSVHLQRYKEILKPEYSIQLVSKPGFEKFFPASGIWMMDYERFLGRLV